MTNTNPLNTFLIRDSGEGVTQGPPTTSQYPPLIPQPPFLAPDTFLTLPEQMEGEGEGVSQGGLLYLDSASALHVFVHHLPQPPQPTPQLVEEEEDSQEQFVVVGALKNGDLPPPSPPPTCHVSVDSILEEDLVGGRREEIYLPQPPNPTPTTQTLPPTPVLTLVGDGGGANPGDTSNITLDTVPHITLEEIIQKFASSPESPVDHSPDTTTITTITQPPEPPPLPPESKVRVKLLESRERDEGVLVESDEGCLYDVLVTYRCRVCGEVYEEKEDLIQHHNQYHKQTQGGVVKIRVTTSNTSTTTTTTHLSPPGPDKDQNVSIHSCSFCSLDFQTLRECQEHINKDHPSKAGEGIARHSRPHGASDKYPAQPGLLIGHRKTRTPATQVEAMDVDSDEGVEGKRKVKTPRSLQDQFWLQKQRQKPVCLVEVEKTYRCPVSPCKYKFSSEANLQFHQECHGGGEGEDRGFTCPHCSSRYDKWSLCQLHLWKEHSMDIDLLTCGICHTYKTCTQQRLLVHQKIHSDLKEHVCKTCGKEFKQLAQLLNHQVSHITDPKDYPPWAAEKRYCEECQKWFKDRKTLRTHISLIHLKRKPHSCPDCPYRSSRKFELTVHMRQHTGERPHKCPLCGWTARDHNAIRRHKLGHQDIKPFRCPAALCQFGSRSPSYFKRHMARLHPNNEAVYRCQFCPLETAYLQEYITHSMKHEKLLLEQTMKRCLQDNTEAERAQGGDGNKVETGDGTAAPTPPNTTNITALQNLDINQKMEFITIKFDERSFQHTKEDGKVSTGSAVEAVSLPQVVVNNGHYIIGLPSELSPMRDGEGECQMNQQTPHDLKLKPHVTTISHVSPTPHYSSSQTQNTSPHHCNSIT